MAYISKLFQNDEEWSGPYPNKAGESCGNAKRSSLKVAADGTVEATWSDNDSDWPSGGWHACSNHKIGAPSSCKAGTSEEMSADGYVGLYLIADSDEHVGHILEVDTDILEEEVVTGKRPPRHPFNPGVPVKDYSEV